MTICPTCGAEIMIGYRCAKCILDASIANGTARPIGNLAVADDEADATCVHGFPPGCGICANADDEFCAGLADADEAYNGDGWCIECGDEFHYDDCGGYNPPCACGFHCRSCHEAGRYVDINDADDQDDDGPPCEECGGWHVMRYCHECGEIACSNCRCEQEDDDT